MEARELAVGNYYTSTKFQKPVICEMADMWEIYERAEGATPGESEVDSVFEPIRFTEQWLKDLGGLKKQSGYYSFDEQSELPNFRFFYYKGNVHCSLGDDNNGVTFRVIKYVHELQNLWYSLTGKELKK